MTEPELIAQWNTARWHIIVSQLAPTFLLAVTLWMLVDGLAETELPVRLAAAGILLASGVLGAITQFAAASEGRAIIESLRSMPSSSTLSRRIVAMGRGVEIVRFVTPAIFVLTFVALLWALFL
ncbi:hypothetical protein [Yonghaparkia sp. Soil809]|uniref:hypothetical protein n=1 Tax=Yonghaparkia sp. Soil809 TaxID=1736417 RepID=UPI0006F24E7A|nr:hypothetical protein [Yonghaparkia sp. Soil809]KRF31199.1 hypothetical protein ASG83_10370 [Yonghaparkia sp. Soil809]